MEYVEWAAGFFDGEGCISFKGGAGGKYAGRYVHLIVEQKDRRPLDRLQTLFGGNIYAGTNKWRWSIQQKDLVRKALTLMLPHLTVKRERALVGLERLTLVYPRESRQEKMSKT